MPRITNELSTSRVVIRNCSLDWYTNDLLSCEWQIRGLSYRSETGNLCCTVSLVAEGFARASQLVNQPCRFQPLKKLSSFFYLFISVWWISYQKISIACTIATMIHGVFFLYEKLFCNLYTLRSSALIVED